MNTTLSSSSDETCKCPDPRLLLSKQRQFANSQKKSGISTYALHDGNLITGQQNSGLETAKLVLEALGITL